MYIDLRPGQTCHSKDAEVTYSIGVGELGWQYGTGLKSHGTVTDWCTSRKWPVNCMTVISAWWQSNMPFQRRREVTHSDGHLWGDIEWAIELLYNSVKTGSQLVWRSKRVWRQDVVEKTSTQQKAGPPGLRLSSPGERERNPDGHKSGEVNMLQFCSVSNSLSHTTLSNKVRGIFF